ncbi:hypothetical protein M0R72_10605 [Candidatus Pacearchaeota archaeon]|nr:hypothetical protein [Candidatus Pacearchaeota archaeon]
MSTCSRCGCAVYVRSGDGWDDDTDLCYDCLRTSEALGVRSVTATRHARPLRRRGNENDRPTNPEVPVVRSGGARYSQYSLGSSHAVGLRIVLHSRRLVGMGATTTCPICRVREPHHRPA